MVLAFKKKNHAYPLCEVVFSILLDGAWHLKLDVQLIVICITITGDTLNITF